MAENSGKPLEYRGYTVRFSIKMLRGCVLDRTFPVEIEKNGALVQYARTVEGAKKWIEEQERKQRGK